MKRNRNLPGNRHTSVVLLALLFLLVAGVTGCRKQTRRPAPRTVPSSGEEIGLASWYGHPYHGRKTANGETYDMYSMTAAHRTLAFNTWVRVVNLENNLTTVVRINDRGPFIEGRIIDLSKKAAEEIQMVGSGIALVRLDIIEGPGVAENPALYSVQVGAFLVPDNAEKLQRKLSRKFSGVFVDIHEKPDGLYYRVRVGRHSTIQGAEAVAARLRRQKEVTQAVVVRLN